MVIDSQDWYWTKYVVWSWTANLPSYPSQVLAYVVSCLADLKLLIHLPLSPECWNYVHASPSLANILLQNLIFGGLLRWLVRWRWLPTSLTTCVWSLGYAWLKKKYTDFHVYIVAHLHEYIRIHAHVCMLVHTHRDREKYNLKNLIWGSVFTLFCPEGIWGSKSVTIDPCATYIPNRFPGRR